MWLQQDNISYCKYSLLPSFCPSQSRDIMTVLPGARTFRRSASSPPLLRCLNLIGLTRLGLCVNSVSGKTPLPLLVAASASLQATRRLVNTTGHDKNVDNFALRCYLIMLAVLGVPLKHKPLLFLRLVWSFWRWLSGVCHV